MGKITYLLTAILMTLGVTACSVNAGGGSAGEPIPKMPSASSDSSNSTNTSTDTANDPINNGSTNNGSANNGSTNNGLANNDSVNNGSAETDILTNNPNYITATSQAYKYFTNKSAKQELLSKISTMSNITGPCTSAKSSSCSSSVSAGTVIAAYKQSYSNYAVIREAYDGDNRTKPANSFVSLVTHVTPETNKVAALNATYKGQVSYSSKNFLNVITRTDLTLTTTDSTIQGVLNADPTISGKIHPVITFNAGQITASDKGVTFNGAAVFHSRFFNSTSAGSGENLSGTYQGFFAGPNAEEVLGTFETTNYSDEKSVQGAFAGKKQ